MTYGPHPWATGGYGPGPDEAQRAAGTFGEPHVSEQLWAAEQAGATQRDMAELAGRLDAEAAYRRSLDTHLRAAQAPVPPKGPSRTAASASWPWPPMIARPPAICGPDGNPNSPEAIAMQRAAADRTAEAWAAPQNKQRCEHQQEHSRQVSQEGRQRTLINERYEPGRGYWTLKTLALLVFIISVIPAALTVLVGKPIAGWIVACILSGCALGLQACVKRRG